MVERERVTKRACAFCMHPDRDDLEEMLTSGQIDPKILDKDMGWRTNTTDRHQRNHMGEYHIGANPSCPLCADSRRSEFEAAYYAQEVSSEVIAAELECAESAVYHHMKHHFQPRVQKAAPMAVTMAVGSEMGTLRTNVERLNVQLSELLDDGSVFDEHFVKDAVSLHKEVRESIKDLMRYKDEWSGASEQTTNQTINILKVELGKESPDAWRRIRENLIEQYEVEIE